jgi:opacity protein-like surface antigen
LLLGTKEAISTTALVTCYLFLSQAINFHLWKSTMKKSLSILSAALALAVPQVAQADESSYARLLVGVNWTERSSHDHIKDIFRASADFKTGYLVGAAVGYNFCERLTLEGEISFRSNDVDRVKFRPKKGRDHLKHFKGSSGHLEATAYLVNGFYTFPVDECSWMGFQPYVGAGIGYAHQHLKYRLPSNMRVHKEAAMAKDLAIIIGDDSSSCSHRHESPSSGNSCESFAYCKKRKKELSRSENGFAYQFIAGLEYLLCDNIGVDIEYRYFHAQKDTGNNAIVVGLLYGF